MPTPIKPSLYVTIDENGKAFYQAEEISNLETLHGLFSEMSFSENGAIVSLFNDEPCIVEAADAPLIAQHIVANAEGGFQILLHADISFQIQMESLSIDEWDRYHGTILSSPMPFVLSRQAQEEFFDLVDSFTDESFTWKGRDYETPEYWNSENNKDLNENYWSHIYRTEEPKWDLGQASPGLVELYPQLKLPVSRIAVIGGGSGHDAAFLAQQGHHVTLIDISQEAIAKAQLQYAHISNLQFLESDAFHLPQEMVHSFDIVFEHTFYCAIDPRRRNDLVKTWSSLLHETGQLLGVFFTMEKRAGPPFGGSEWELKNRLKNNFKILKWQRFKNSIKGRWGKELVVLLQKRK